MTSVTEGIANFEKCISRLEQALPTAIRQKRLQVSRAATGFVDSSENLDDSNDSTATATGSKDISIVEALIKCIQDNFVDDGCNTPPSNISQIPGLTATEAMTESYRKLVHDFVLYREQWIYAGKTSSSSRQSSKNNSRTSSIKSNSSSSRNFRPKFGAAPIRHSPSMTAQQHQQQHPSLDDEDQQQLVLQQQQQLLPNSEIYDHSHSLKDFKEIGEQVRSVRDLQSDLNTMVDTQQPALDVTEKNVDRAADKVQEGRKNVFQALKHTTLGAGLAGGVVGALVAGPAGFLLGATSTVAVAASMATGSVAGYMTANKIQTTGVLSSVDAESNRTFAKHHHDKTHDDEDDIVSKSKTSSSASASAAAAAASSSTSK